MSSITATNLFNVYLLNGETLDAGFVTRITGLIDDINDSGSTLEEVYKQCYGREIHKPKFATLLSKSSSKFECDYSGELINKDKDNEWIVFPWE